MNSIHNDAEAARVQQIADALEDLHARRPITPRDVARHVFAPIWDQAITSDARVESSPENRLDTVAVALPGGHTFSITAAPGPNSTRVWGLVTASSKGTVDTHRTLTPRDAADHLADWADFNSIPHRA